MLKFKQFVSYISESFSEDAIILEKSNIEKLHFEMDPKKAEKLKVEIGYNQGEVSKRNQIEGANYSLRRFRKEIGYWDGNKKDQEWAEGVFAGPEHYNTVKSTLGAGPHKKKVKVKRWNQKLYDKWIKDMATNNDGSTQDSSYGFEMAQNANFEAGLIDWVKKNNRGEDPLQVIQWDIEGMMESVVNEAKTTDFDKPGKDGDIYFSKREGNAVAVRQGDLLQMIYVYDGEVKLGKIQKTDKRWENMGEPSEKLLIDLKLKNVGGGNSLQGQTEKGKLIYAYLSESIVNEGKMSDKFIGNDEIVFLKTKESSRGAHYNLYYKGHDIDVGGHMFGSEKELKQFADNYILSNQLYNKLRYEDSKPLPESSVNEGATDRFLQSAARNLASQMKGKSASQDSLLNRLNSMPIANRLKPEELDKIVEYTMKEMGLTEGGNAVEESRPMKQSEVIETFKWAEKNILPSLGLSGNGIDYAPIGSYAKKKEDATSGDIDIAVSVDKIAGVNGLTFEEVLPWLDEKLKSLGYSTKAVRGFEQISFGAPINGDFKNGVGQIDIMLSTDLNWSKFMYHSPNFITGESKYKGMYRNVLLMSIVSEMFKESSKLTPEGDTEQYKQYVIRLEKGIYQVEKSFMGKRGSLVKTAKLLKDQDKFITNTPDEVVELAFGKDVKPLEVMTFEDAWVRLRSPKFPHAKKLDAILGRFKKYILSSKMPLPSEAVEAYPNLFNN